MPRRTTTSLIVAETSAPITPEVENVDESQSVTLHRRSAVTAVTESHDTGADGVPGVVSAPRARRAGGRPRQRNDKESAANDHGPWLNADQATEYIGLRTRKALYELVRAGRVPYYRFGHSLRFRREELDEVIAAGRMRPAVYEHHKKEIAVDGPSCADQSEGYDRVDARLQ